MAPGNQNFESITVHELFELQAARTPSDIAVRFEDRTVTYAELSRRSDSLVRELLGRSVGREEPVGVYMERSIEAIAAFLGILKSGGACLPLDPTSPRRRCEAILAASAVRVVITEGRLLDRVPEGVIAIQADRPEIESQDQTDAFPTPRVWPENLAYVVHTATMTGASAGVCIPHSSIVRRVCDPSLQFESHDVFLQSSNLDCESVPMEIWGALLRGGQLVLAPRGPQRVDELSSVLLRERITVLWLPASVFRQMADARPQAFARVRQVFITGGAFAGEYTQRLMAAAPGIRLVCAYGPAESASIACCSVMTEPVASEQVPLGAPLACTGIHVLDREMQPSPAGSCGELYVSGDGLARGYLGPPAGTAAVFVPDPWGAPGARMCRTGDLGYRDPGGALVVQSRCDSQAHLAGYRVALRELERLLESRPGVGAAAVAAREDPRGERRLVAYIVPAADADGSENELRSWLKEQLPPHMMPAGFIMVDAAAANGSLLDRSALPEPDWGGPRSEVEAALMELWRGILEVPHVGRHDNFFELGGYSLLAAKMTIGMTQTFGVMVPPRRFYESPTIAELAETLQELLEARSIEASS